MNPPLSETALIQTLARRFPNRPEITPLGIGDDCALMAPGYSLITMDTMVQGVHFDRRYMSLADIAYRCLASNLSDIAAMGGTPGPFTLSLGVPAPGLNLSQAQELADGLYQAIEDQGLERCWLIGGDVVRTPGALTLSITLLGAPGPKILTRADAQPGDLIVVSRTLGDAHLALLALLKDQPIEDNLKRRHVRPLAECALARRIVAKPAVHAAMDLSDGLAQDLPRLARRSQVALEVDLEALPLSGEARAIANQLGECPVQAAATGGEDFALCFCVAPESAHSLLEDLRTAGHLCHIIGRVRTGEPGVTFLETGQPRDIRVGFQHFPSPA